MEEDIHDGITNVQVTDVSYRHVIAVKLFDEYQTRRNTTNLLILLI